jgi:NitT/TauT family transport system ATP-binding protein
MDAGHSVHIRAQQLSKTFSSSGKETSAYEDLTFDVRPGEFFCILGPSGCGKTSLLRTLAGLESPTSGDLQVAARENATAGVGMVFQEHGLFPWMSLRNNIRFLLENNPGLADKDWDAITDDYLAKVGLSRFAHHYPHQASGGMRQRISIARAFANAPDILLMDEPFVFLDFQTRLALQQLLLSIWAEAKTTVVFVTHDIEEAVLLADRILVMSAHPGQVKTMLDIELERPREAIAVRKSAKYHGYVDDILALLQEEYALSADLLSAEADS